MPAKIPIYPERIRRVPKHFNWIDGRLVRDHHLDKCSHPAAALYLFLITVSDAQGLSYYSDQSIGQRLNMDSCILAQARLELVQHELIAYKKPCIRCLIWLHLNSPFRSPGINPGTRSPSAKSSGRSWRAVHD
jgi:hypothetical protein